VSATGHDDGPLDPHDATLVDDAPERLRPFNAAGVLHPADIHAAVALCGLTGCEDDDVLLATALAIRGPRVGHVCVDLTTVHATVADVEDDAGTLRDLPWPTDVDTWVTAGSRTLPDSSRSSATGAPRRPLRARSRAP
jgi:exodeoxyribonuclease V alpha subunit